MDLFTAGYGYANADLAAIYGVEEPLQEFDRVTFPAASERAGLLGQALFLAITAKPEESSPTAREVSSPARQRVDGYRAQPRRRTDASQVR